MSKKTKILVLSAALAMIVLRKRETRGRDTGWPVNFAHRGASLEAPENTPEAFRLGAEAGAGGLELDVHMTSDGRVVVMHDDSVDRTTNGSGLVRGMTLWEVQGLDASYRFTPDGGETYPFRGRGVRAPELGEVFREFPDHRVNIDIKEVQPGVEAAVLGAIQDAGAAERALVVSALPGVVKRFRAIAGGDVRTGASRREVAVFYFLCRLRAEFLLRPAYAALQVPVRFGGRELVTPRFVRAAHGRGVRVDAWTIDDEEEMRRLLDLGVDVVMTNRPGALARVLRKRR